MWVPVLALISQLTATGQVPYVGLDNWKVGRTAAWAVAQIAKVPGKVGILVEFAPEFTLLEPLSTFESSTIAQEMTERLLRDHPDLAGAGNRGRHDPRRRAGRERGKSHRGPAVWRAEPREYLTG